MVVCIARRQGIINTTQLGLEMKVSSKYLRKLAGPLEKHGILRSEQGLHGGYTLNRPAAEISLKMIFDAFEESIIFSECLHDKPCEMYDGCLVKPIWEQLDHAINDRIDHTTVGDILGNH